MKIETKMWATRLIILLILVAAFFIIKNQLDDVDGFPTGTPLNEDSLKFNSEEWKMPREYYEEIRPYMLRDLKTNVLLVGMDSAKVKNLLGETWGPHDGRRWNYRLGVYREVEASYLEIEFDDKGKLRRVDIVDR